MFSTFLISNISEEDFSGSSLHTSALASPLRIDFSDEEDDYTNPHPRRSKRSASKLKFEEPLQPLSNRNRGLRRTLDEGSFKILKDYFYKVDVEISNNPKICRILPYFFLLVGK